MPNNEGPMDSLMPELDKYKGNEYINVYEHFCNKMSPTS